MNKEFDHRFPTISRLFGVTKRFFAKRQGLKLLVFAALLNAILFGLFFAVATPYYETNDDLGMQLIASGFYTGHPSEYLIFTNVILGWALRVLYGLWGGCNWYLVYLLTVHYTALTAIAFVVFSRRPGRLFAMVYVGFFLLVETRVLLLLQFTTTAFLAGTAGVLLLVDALRPGERVHWPKAILGLVFTALMAMIREPVAPLLAVIAAPFICERLGFAGWRRMLAAGLACSAILLCSSGINRWYYQRDPAWAEFIEYNGLRGKIQYTPLERFIPQAVSAAGWSENDGQMFANFYFSEPEVYGQVSKMRSFFNQLHAVSKPERFQSRFSRFNLFLPKLFGRDAGILMYLAIFNAALCVALAGVHRQKYLITLLVMYGVVATLSYYLLATGRLPQRVSYNIPLFIHAACLYWAAGLGGAPAASPKGNFFGGILDGARRAGLLRAPFRTLLPIWLALYCFFLFQLGQSLWFANASNHRLKLVSRTICNPIQTLSPAGRKPILVGMPHDSVLEQCLFFYPATEQIPFHFVPNGWLTHSPLFKENLDRHNLHPYSLSLLDRADVFFLMETRWIEPLRVFYREHYGIDVRFDTVLNSDGLPQYQDCQFQLYQAHAVGTSLSQQAAR